MIANIIILLWLLLCLAARSDIFLYVLYYHYSATTITIISILIIFKLINFKISNILFRNTNMVVTIYLLIWIFFIVEVYFDFKDYNMEYLLKYEPFALLFTFPTGIIIFVYGMLNGMNGPLYILYNFIFGYTIACYIQIVLFLFLNKKFMQFR